MNHLLIVDDEQAILNALKRELHGPEWSVTTSTDTKEALDALHTSPFDIVISDYRMPVMDGVTFLTEVGRLYPTVVRIILSGYSDAQAILRSVNQAQIFKYLVKPWESDELRRVLMEAYVHRRELSEGRRLITEKRKKEDRSYRRVLEAQRLEREEPGITDVVFGPDNGIMLADE